METTVSHSLASLPIEVLGLLLEFLNARDGRSLDQTCSQFRGVVRNLVKDVRASLASCSEPGDSHVELINTREILWFPNVKRVTGRCRVLRLDERAPLSLERPLHLEIAWNDYLLTGCLMFMHTFCTRYPGSSLVIYDGWSDKELYRYEPGYLHLTVDIIDPFVGKSLFRALIRDLSFSSLRLSRSFRSKNGLWNKNLRDTLEPLGLESKRIEELVIDKLHESLSPRFFPHLRTIRFLHPGNHKEKNSQHDVYAVFNDRVMVTHIDNGVTYIRGSNWKYFLGRCLSIGFENFYTRFPNLETGDVTFIVNSNLSPDDIAPSLETLKTMIQGVYPHLTILVQHRSGGLRFGEMERDINFSGNLSHLFARTSQQHSMTSK